jgi:CRISPR-associated protein Cmr3
MNSTSTLTRSFLLDPLDALFFRDGRPFEAATRAQSIEPQPRTIAGAFRSALLRRLDCDFASLARAIRSGAAPRDAAAVACPEPDLAIHAMDTRFAGPWFAMDCPVSPRILYPLPACLRRRESDGNVVRLAPLDDEALARSANGQPPLWHRETGRVVRCDGLLDGEGLSIFLQGGTPGPEHLVERTELFAIEQRTGIAIDTATGAAREGMIYGTGMLRLRPGVRLHGEIELARELEPVLDACDLLALGGEGRQAAVTYGDPLPPRTHLASGDTGACILLTSPCPVDAAGMPAIEGVITFAAGDPVAISGWDLARGGPLPTRFMAPAGAVYYLAPRTALPSGRPCADDDAAAGWGQFCMGAWTYV